MAIYATNGSRLYIGDVLAAKSSDFVADDFPTGEGAWTEIGETENFGSFGDTSTEIAFDGIASSRTRRLKGTRNAGTKEVVCGIDYEDPGQIALLAAEKTPYDYAFRLVLNDAPPGGSPSERLFVAKVGSVVEALDTANNVMKLNASLWVNSNIVKIDATGG